MARKDSVAADDYRAEVARLKATMPELEAAEREAGAALDVELAAIPNLPLEDTPDGKDENDNVELRQHGSRPTFPEGFKPREHFEIGEALGLMDFDAAAKMSGARFVVLKGALARLERALEQFMLDLHTGQHGYTEIAPPVLVRDAAMFGTAQLPKFKDDQFWAVGGELLHEASDDEIALLDPLDAQAALVSRLTMIRSRRLGLIHTAEGPLPNLVRESIVDEEVLKRLGLHYRVMALSTGDLGFASQKTYDLEVWLPGQGRFREISSCSICGDFQARRMHARCKAADAKHTRFVHTLNGSGVATGRALVAVLENYQEPDGSVTVPEALRPYMGGLERIEAK